ncbi:MAG: putative outer rane channel [Verrucomicrobiales bacterium]|nr:putative outer rane channel [Verrucomicrobiales bacterium]
MGKNIRSTSWISGSLFCLTMAAAPAFSQNFYFNADAGGTIAKDVNLRSFFGATPGEKVKFDPGVRFGAAGGYNFCPIGGIEFETGFMHNTVRRLGSGTGNGDAELSHVPLMANLVLRYDQGNCPVIPYIGAGAGGDISVVNLDHVTFNSVFADGSDATIQFAWQAFGGLRYKLNDKMSVGASYKYYRTDPASWEFAGVKDGIQIGRSEVHGFMVEFNMKF